MEIPSPKLLMSKDVVTPFGVRQIKLLWGDVTGADEHDGEVAAFAAGPIALEPVEEADVHAKESVPQLLLVYKARLAAAGANESELSFLDEDFNLGARSNQVWFCRCL
jgi:hypothetical protein